MSSADTLVGRAVKRIEGKRFLIGQRSFVADTTVPGRYLYAAAAIVPMQSRQHRRQCGMRFARRYRCITVTDIGPAPTFS